MNVTHETAQLIFLSPLKPPEASKSFAKQKNRFQLCATTLKSIHEKRQAEAGVPSGEGQATESCE
jgi:hypothetical protein